MQVYKIEFYQFPPIKKDFFLLFLYKKILKYKHIKKHIYTN